MSNSDHWNILASEIGAELPADPAPPPTANAPAPPKRERPERKAAPPAKKQADWSQVASVLGIEVAASAPAAPASPATATPAALPRQPERQPRQPEREPAAREPIHREPISRERAAEPVRRPAPTEPSRRPEPTPFPPAASTSNTSEAEFVEVEMVEEFQQDGPHEAAGDGGESKEERPRRRRRRRRGGRRSASGRSNENAEPGAAEPADAMDTRDLGHLHDELADDEGTDLDDEGDSAAAASNAAATEGGGADRKERPRRRRRRRGGRGSSASGDKPRGERPRAADIQSRLDQESQDQQKLPAGDDLGDESSDEFDEHDAPQGGDAQFASARTGGERDTRADVDLDEEDHLDDQLGDPLGEGQEHDDAADEALDKNSHRAIPSWEQAIGLIVAVNMDARARNPKSGHTRGRGRGRRPERGGDRGGGGHHRS